MARPKESDTPTAQVTFRCPVDVKYGLKILGLLDGGKSVSKMIVEILSEFVKENERRIKALERSRAERPIKKPKYEPMIKADDKQAKSIVQKDSGTATAEGGVYNAED